MPARCVEVHTAHPVAEAEVPKCQLAMCQLNCKYGMKKDDKGCELCGCHDPCDGHGCGEQEFCKVVNGSTTPTAVCKARPLCHRVHDIFVKKQEPLMAEPTCRSNGEFEPMQCHQKSGECWCVDDRGIEIANSRKSTKAETTCKPHRCHHAHVGFDLRHSIDSLDEQMAALQRQMEVQLSSIMTIERTFIDKVVITRQGVDIIHTEFDVIRHPLAPGQTFTEVDVATTVYHLNNRIQNGDVVIIFGTNELAPVPESWKATHHYDGRVVEEPEVPKDGPLCEYPNGFSGWYRSTYRRHRITFTVGLFGTIIFMTCIIAMAMVMLRKKRVIRKTKEKQMRTYKENLAFSNQLYDKMVLPTNDDVEEKNPLEGAKIDSIA